MCSCVKIRLCALRSRPDIVRLTSIHIRIGMIALAFTARACKAQFGVANQHIRLRRLIIVVTFSHVRVFTFKLFQRLPCPQPIARTRNAACTSARARLCGSACKRREELWEMVTIRVLELSQPTLPQSTQSLHPGQRRSATALARTALHHSRMIVIALLV